VVILPWNNEFVLSVLMSVNVKLADSVVITLAAVVSPQMTTLFSTLSIPNSSRTISRASADLVPAGRLVLQLELIEDAKHSQHRDPERITIQRMMTGNLNLSRKSIYLVPPFDPLLGVDFSINLLFPAGMFILFPVLPLPLLCISPMQQQKGL